MSTDKTFAAWHRADENKKYYALRLTLAYIAGDTAEVERFASLFKEADAEQDRLDRELGEQK